LNSWGSTSIFGRKFGAKAKNSQNRRLIFQKE
jgi:hypothetical protein